ncbi:MAG: hypothetical protein AAGD35_19640 [Actinomycetota bacterium]
MAEFLRKHWLPLASTLAFVGVVLVVGALLRIAEVAWSDAWPWILLGIGAAALFGALVVQSYAPPGPNLIERAMKTEAEPLLVVLGIGLVAIGTGYWFDFGSNDADSPSNWWIVVIGIGVVVLMVGVLRTYSGARTAADISWFQEVHAHRRRVDRMAGAVVGSATDVGGISGVGQATIADGARLVAAVADKQARAERLVEEAEKLRALQSDLRAMSRTLAQEAESDRDHARKILASARNQRRTQATPPSTALGAAMPPAGPGAPGGTP